MLPYHIHSFITQARRQRAENDVPEPASSSEERSVHPGKEYPRMKRIPLPKLESDVSLSAAFRDRISNHTVTEEPLSLVSLGGIMEGIGINTRGSRTYPSGGAKYPIEAYVLVQRVESLERGTYHYHPHTHTLEQLWELPQSPDLFSSVNQWAKDARVLILFTASWWRSAEKYKDFGYLLGMLEAGHAAQNILLAAAALQVPACPLGGFNDDVVNEMLDLDPRFEQPVYMIALG